MEGGLKSKKVLVGREEERKRAEVEGDAFEARWGILFLPLLLIHYRS